MTIDVMARTDGQPKIDDLSRRQWRAQLRADFGIRLPADTPHETLYVTWCEEYLKRHSSPAPATPQPYEPEKAA